MTDQAFSNHNDEAVEGYAETEAGAAAALALAAADPSYLDHEQRAATIVVPPGSELHIVDVSAYADRPHRKMGTATLHDIRSLADYVNLHQAPGKAVVYANVATQSFLAVLNDHTDTDAGWGDHRAHFVLAKTKEWRHWEQQDGKLMAQGDFAAHIEWGIDTIAEPAGADLLELAQSFEATVSANFRQAQRLSSGERKLIYEETIDARAGQAGEITVPAEFKLALRPFEGEDAEAAFVVARLRYRLNGGNLLIGYQLIRPDLVLREEFDERLAWLRDHVGDTLILMGTPPG